MESVPQAERALEGAKAGNGERTRNQSFSKTHFIISNTYDEAIVGVLFIGSKIGFGIIILIGCSTVYYPYPRLPAAAWSRDNKAVTTDQLAFLAKGLRFQFKKFQELPK